ncbi:MAG: ASCH domain-containing protein, partial [Myxococcota bacterium]
MLLKQATLEGIRDGRIDRQYRVWRRPTVKTDGTLTTSIGVLRVREVAETKRTALTREEARKAGFESKRALLDQLKGRDGRLYRILLELEGEDPRIALRGRALTTPEERPRG